MLKENNVQIPIKGHTLEGTLTLLERMQGIVLFVHGSGSSRMSPRNQFVARSLNEAGMGTLLFDLLTPEEEEMDMVTGEYRFHIPFLSNRLIEVTDWIINNPKTINLPIGYFGASTGAAAALVAAAHYPSLVKAIVSRGGRPDLADSSLKEVHSATLLIVGGKDHLVIEMNENAFQKLSCTKGFVIIPGATHLFEEPGTLEEVSQTAQNWFKEHLF
jgi:dienelactone hydrolase